MNGAATQKRLPYSFLVTWPSEPAAFCPAELRDVAEQQAGKSYRCRYPTLKAMDLAAEGFRMAGAAVTS
jgi:hypothetical protein